MFHHNVFYILGKRLSTQITLITQLGIRDILLWCQCALQELHLPTGYIKLTVYMYGIHMTIC